MKVTRKQKRAAAWQLARSLLLLAAIPVAVVVALIAEPKNALAALSGILAFAIIVVGAYWVIRIAVRHGTRDAGR